MTEGAVESYLLSSQIRVFEIWTVLQTNFFCC
jgi:hypothetical protein